MPRSTKKSRLISATGTPTESRTTPRRAYYPLRTIAGWTSRAGGEKWKTKRIGGERDWKGNGLKENGGRKREAEEGEKATGGEERVEENPRHHCRRPSRRRPILLHVSPNSPDSRCEIPTSQTEAQVMLSG